ncbi:MAG: hypothetical protein K6A29_04195 [Lachnospiraceae bacterium]|nr:hypothetical protein [Lachnospiraceae bacterium]
MLEFLKSSWVVGIVTGIISGFLVYIFTNLIMKKKGKVEYYKNVSEANHYVIATLKPYISEKGLPNVDIFNAIISSTARKYSVGKNDMFSVAVFCEELIREIIGDVYVASEKKKEYTDSLVIYINELKKSKDTKDKVDIILDSNKIYNYRKKITLYFSLLISIIVCFFAIIISWPEDISFWYPFEDEPLLWIPVVLILAVCSAISISQGKGTIGIILGGLKENYNKLRKSKRSVKEKTEENVDECESQKGK